MPDFAEAADLLRTIVNKTKFTVAKDGSADMKAELTDPEMERLCKWVDADAKEREDN